MTVPRWVAALLRFLAVPGRADDAIGDLNEMHARRVRRHGRLVATALSAFGATDMAVALLRQRVGSAATAVSAARPGHAGTGPHDDDSGRWDMGRILDNWTRDIVHAARALRRAPGFTLVTVATLAIALGSNTAIFTVVDAVLLDPLDFPAADRLVRIAASAPGTDMPEEFGPAPEFYIQYSEHADMLEDLGMYVTGQTTVRSEEHTERLFIAQATSDLFTTLGATPAAGRLPTEEDPAGRVMVISHWLWENWFGSDPEVIGRSFEVSGDARTVIGVLASNFRFPDERTAVWLHQRLGDPSQARPGQFGFNLVGRTRPGVEIENLEAQLATLAARLPERFGGPPRYAAIIEQHRPVVRTLEEDLVGDVARPLWLLLGAVAVVLLVACANIANLFAVRAAGRRRDLAVRRALGAERAGLVRAQMAEALLLAALGGAGGVLIARLGIPVLVRAAPENVPNLGLVGLDATALLFTAGASIVTALVFGLVPALRFSRHQTVGALRQTGGVGGQRSTARDGLVLLQTASALVLLVGSGLLLRSFWTLSHVDPGYDTRDIFTFQVAPARDELRDGPTFARFHESFMERVAALPGVTSVGLTNWLPLDEGAATNRFYTERHLASGEEPSPLRFTFVGGDYFATMGISIVRGRGIEPSDHAVGVGSAVVSASAADQLWPAEDPLGKRFLMSSDSTVGWLTVVGVAEEILLDDFRQDAPDPMLYLPMVGPTADRWAVGSPAYVVRTPRAGVIAGDVRALMREHVPESPMYRVFTMEGLADRSMAQLAFTMLMVGIAASMALVLGAVGLYGVLSYVVSSRAREIAVRMALGAEARNVRRMVVVQGARITVAGVATGLLGALLLTRLLDSMLFGVGPLDVPTFAAMSMVMLAVASLASYIPARRASSVDPMHSLRTE